MARVTCTAVLCAAIAAAAMTGCSQKVLVRTEPPGLHVRLGDTDLGKVEAQGVETDVGLGVSPVPLTLEHGGRDVVGEVPRTDLVWWVVGTAVAGACCCVPTLATGGLVLANLGIVPACFGCLVTLNPGTCVTALAAPSWFTLPFVAGGTAAGLTPLGLLAISRQVPAQVVVRPPPPAPSNDDAAKPKAMAW